MRIEWQRQPRRLARTVSCLAETWGSRSPVVGQPVTAHDPTQWWTFVDPAVSFGRQASFMASMNPAQTSLPGGLVTNAFPHGTVHQAKEDLQAAVRSNAKILSLWESLTPLGRNEFICWVDDAKQAKTRQRRIERTCEELLEGKKRPCCWVGCIHRTDKAPSRWQQAVLIDKKGKDDL